MRTRTTFFLAIAAAALVVGAASAARASYSKGDANAVLEAFGNGGWAVLNHSKTGYSPGAAAQGRPGQVAIRPFGGSPFDGARYCASDWHTILLADIEFGPRRDAAAFIDDQRYTFTLDGVVQATSRTAIKRFLNPALFGIDDDLYYAQWGRVVAPSELAPGVHTLDVVGTTAAGDPLFADGITFYVDAAGTGACL
jgi:hypothetical protein